MAGGGQSKQMPVAGMKRGREEDDDVCSICLETLDAPQTSVAKLSCGHSFHPHCVNRWIEDSASCPNCRASPSVITIYLCGRHGEHRERSRRCVPTDPPKQDLPVEDAGLYGSRFAPDTLLSAHHRAVLRVFRELLVGSAPNAALVGMEARSGLELRSRVLA